MIVGVTVGVLTEMAGYLPRPWDYVAQLATPWILASFLVALLCRRAIGAIIAGALTMQVALTSNATYRYFHYGHAASRIFIYGVPAWLAMAAIGGGIIGLAAYATKDERTWIRAVGCGVCRSL